MTEKKLSERKKFMTEFIKANEQYYQKHKKQIQQEKTEKYRREINRKVRERHKAETQILNRELKNELNKGKYRELNIVEREYLVRMVSITEG